MHLVQLLRAVALALLVAFFMPGTAQAQTDLSGLWTGQSSGNQVRLEMRSGGFVQLPAGTQNAGQKAGEFFFRDAGSGQYLYTKPDGNDVRVQMLGPDTIRVTNPDGWTDVFTRPARAAASSPPVGAQSAPGGMCLEILADGKGFRNTCPDSVSYAWCIINPDFPSLQEGKYYYGQPSCEKEEVTSTMIGAAGTGRDFRREGPRSLFFGEGVVWFECRSTGGVLATTRSERFVLKPRPHFEGYCLGLNGQKFPGLSASGQVPGGGTSAGNTPTLANGRSPIMEEAWNGVGEPPKAPAPAKKIGVRGKAKDRPVPHLSDDQKVLIEILRLTTPSSRKSEADARFEAALFEYEQKLAAQQKAVADYAAAQQQMATDKAAAAARASAAQQEFARQQAAYQAEQDRYAREKAEYEAQLTGQPVAEQSAGTLPTLSTSGPGGSIVPPLRPTAALEAHNPANEASQCLDLIIKRDFEARGVSTIMGAVFRNSCPYPIETRWCIGGRCATGYDNLATVPNDDIATERKESDFGISYDQPAPGTTTETRWAGCRNGFAYRPDFAGTLHYACK